MTPQRKTEPGPYERQVFGIRVLRPSHPRLRQLRRQHTPSFQGHRLWNATWLLLSYLESHAPAKPARIMEVEMDAAGASEIASRARGTPRIVNRLLRRVRDFTDVKGDGRINADIAQSAMDMLDVDPNGFDVMDRKLLLAIIERFDGGPVGVESLAAAIGEERGTIEDVLEPFLIQQGYLMRTPRGRVATNRAYQHFGLTARDARGNETIPLFDRDSA